MSAFMAVTSIVEADETVILKSTKGSRKPVVASDG